MTKRLPKVLSKPETRNLKKSPHTGYQNFKFKRVMIFLLFFVRDANTVHATRKSFIIAV